MGSYLQESQNTQDKKEKKDKLKSIINEGDDKNLTALHYACQKKCVQTVKLLLEHGGGMFDDVFLHDKMILFYL